MINNRYDFCIGTNKQGLQRTVTAILSEAGFHSSGVGRNIPDLLRTLRKVQPWLTVVDTALPPGNIAQLADIIEEDALSAAIYINTSGADLNLYVQLTWPVETTVLTAVAETVCNEFAHKKKLRKEIEDLQNKLNERKLIERAKGILSRTYNLGENEAYQLLRKSSMKERISTAEMSAKIISDPYYFSG